MMTKKPFWISWWSTDVAFTLHTPWWISGHRGDDGADSICAAVRAEDEDAAKALVQAAHDDPSVAIEWRFVGERPADWTPFSDRFQRAAWMEW
jgi:hypothetical protein